MALVFHSSPLRSAKQQFQQTNLLSNRRNIGYAEAQVFTYAILPTHDYSLNLPSRIYAYVPYDSPVGKPDFYDLTLMSHPVPERWGYPVSIRFTHR